MPSRDLNNISDLEQLYLDAFNSVAALQTMYFGDERHFIADQANNIIYPIVQFFIPDGSIEGNQGGIHKNWDIEFLVLQNVDKEDLTAEIQAYKDTELIYHELLLFFLKEGVSKLQNVRFNDRGGMYTDNTFGWSVSTIFRKVANLCPPQP